ncbi:uncharacterized protein B0H18DRAFT_536794 [Fomitopsis serialis]|uniref:uncharacterized protein n=1 Tax=Fomitopsis serialis TaxID=139415 RepID=UPI0020079C7F|nr:uncharacterized protein B0H18DRAFT_536794 [Neoantrodia serialis]KAH9921760.1 hypothetical protein B0H18DRAFT_536794 [Neoantrodia serialis]
MRARHGDVMGGRPPRGKGKDGHDSDVRSIPDRLDARHPAEAIQRTQAGCLATDRDRLTEGCSWLSKSSAPRRTQLGLGAWTGLRQWHGKPWSRQSPCGSSNSRTQLFPIANAHIHKYMASDCASAHKSTSRARRVRVRRCPISSLPISSLPPTPHTHKSCHQVPTILLISVRAVPINRMTRDRAPMNRAMRNPVPMNGLSRNTPKHGPSDAGGMPVFKALCP